MKKSWKIGVVQDTSEMILGFHDLHQGFRGLPGVEVVAHVDSNIVDIEKRMAYGAKRHYLKYTEMLDCEKPDIVILCSRHPYDHFDQIKEAVERGIHIYCEKPMTVSLEEADQIIELTEKYHIKICMAHPARYSLTFRTMKAMIEAGEIGTVINACGRGKCDHRGGGEDLIVLGTHILDLQTFFFGSPEYVMADINTDGKPIVITDRSEAVEPLGPVAGDEIFAHFRFPNGVSGSFESRKDLLDKDSDIIHMGITVTGTKGTLSMRFNEREISGLRISRILAPPEDFTEYEEVPLTETRVIPGAAPQEQCWSKFFQESNRFALWDLMQSIVEDRLPESNQYNARIAQEMIYGIYQSHLEGKRVSFPLTAKTHPLNK